MIEISRELFLVLVIFAIIGAGLTLGLLCWLATMFANWLLDRSERKLEK